jgi:hypothetical protein
MEPFTYSKRLSNASEPSWSRDTRTNPYAYGVQKEQPDMVNSTYVPTQERAIASYSGDPTFFVELLPPKQPPWNVVGSTHMTPLFNSPLWEGAIGQTMKLDPQFNGRQKVRNPLPWMDTTRLPKRYSTF